jgi:hypothetical protein
MTKIYTPEQQDFIREARTEYCEFARKIDAAKEEHKAIFEALIDRLGLDTKEQKEDIKSLKSGFSIYYKDSKDEVERTTQGAIEIAGL